MQNKSRTMSWIEAISLSLDLPEDKNRLYQIIKEIRSLLEGERERQVKLSLYRSTKVNTNWAIHLQRDTSSVSPQKTGIGRDFVSVFSHLGQVEHAIWKKVPGTSEAMG
ncbi:MAG: hypothetical protein MJE63_19785 [Proteobacteria bacterium]|nr:hypothetical protein [Pseudomonadota bacterium]